MSDLARWELRGPVRTLRTQFAEWNPETREWWPLKNRFVATFRADGQLSEIEHHNPDGSVPREVRVYDDAGRLTEWSFSRRFSRTTRFRSRHIHTTQKAVGLKVFAVWGKLSEERVTVRYDDFDNPVEEVRSDVNREMRMDDGAVKSEERPSHVQHVRFEYQYDAHGNWTERTVWQRMEPNADERPSNIERRTFSY